MEQIHSFSFLLSSPCCRALPTEINENLSPKCPFSPMISSSLLPNYRTLKASHLSQLQGYTTWPKTIEAVINLKTHGGHVSLSEGKGQEILSTLSRQNCSRHKEVGFISGLIRGVGFQHRLDYISRLGIKCLYLLLSAYLTGWEWTVYQCRPIFMTWR